MKHIIITLIVFLLPGHLFAQEEDMQAKADSLFQIGDSLQIQDMDLAYNYYSQARDLDHGIGNLEKEYNCLLYMGDCACNFSKYNDIYINGVVKSFNNYNEALTVAKSIDDSFKDLRQFIIYKRFIDVNDKIDNIEGVLRFKNELYTLAVNSSDSRLKIIKSLMLAEQALPQYQLSCCRSYLIETDSIFYKCLKSETGLSYNDYIETAYIFNYDLEKEDDGINAIYYTSLVDIQAYSFLSYFYSDIQNWIKSVYKSYCQISAKCCEFQSGCYYYTKQYAKACEEYNNYIKFVKTYDDLYFINYIQCASLGGNLESIDYSLTSLDYFKKGIIEYQKINKSASKELKRFKSMNDVDFLWIWYYGFSGFVYARFNELDSAYVNYKKALNYLEKEQVLSRLYSQDNLNKDYYDFMSNLIFVFLQKGGCEEALTQCQELIKFCYHCFGSASSEYANALKLMGDIYRKRADKLNGDAKTSLELYLISNEIYKSFFLSSFNYSFFDENDLFWKNYTCLMRNMIDITLMANEKDEFAKNCYNALLLSKGCLLESEKSFAKYVYTTKDPEIIDKYNKKERFQLSLKNHIRDFEENKAEIFCLIDSINAYKEALDTLVDDEGYRNFLSLEYNSIRHHLREHEYVVDFLDFESKDGVHQYVAYVFNKDDNYPHLIKVFTEEMWKSLTKGKSSYEIYKTPLSDNVIDSIWKPICASIPEGSTVFFVPSGVLHQVALESLPIGGNYKFIRLSSAREVIERKDSIAVNSSVRSNAVLYGGLQYSADLPEMEAEASKYENQSFAATRGGLSINGNDEWQPLKWSAVEVDSVGKILQDNHVNTIPFKGLKGVEESFLDMHNRAPQILLLSTHGFYYNPEEADKIDYLRGYTDAMSLSGLILSGANYAWKGKELPDGVLPGILTADKISQLNLDGLDLVVLSACHTARGKVTPEGIYGLQRAFKKAGAGTIVMTLWDVDDEVTKDFIIQFFKNLSSNGWNKREAFDAAKETIRSQNENFPKLWAGFVMLD